MVATLTSDIALVVVENDMRPHALMRELSRGYMQDAHFDSAITKLRNRGGPGKLKIVVASSIADRLGRGETTSLDG